MKVVSLETIHPKLNVSDFDLYFADTLTFLGQVTSVVNGSFYVDAQNDPLKYGYRYDNHLYYCALRKVPDGFFYLSLYDFHNKRYYTNLELRIILETICSQWWCPLVSRGRHDQGIVFENEVDAFLFLNYMESR